MNTDMYLIFLDIDGTLLSPRGVHPRTLEAIRRAQAAGHRVFINSGRSRGIIPEDLLEAVRPDGIVGGLGSWVYDGGEVLYARVLSEEDIRFAMYIARKYRISLVLEGENDCAGYCGTGWWGEERTVRSEEELFARFPHPRVSKMTYMTRLTPDIVAELDSRFAVFNHPTYAEVGIKGCSKATGMELLRRRWGVDRAHVIAMGDSDNDTEMLLAAGISVAMGNAVDGIRELCDFVTTDCDEGGVGYALERLVPGVGNAAE